MILLSLFFFFYIGHEMLAEQLSEKARLRWWRTNYTSSVLKKTPKHRNPHKTQNPEQYISFVWGLVIVLASFRKGRKQFSKEMKVLWSKPHNVSCVVWVLWHFKCLQKRQIVMLNQLLIYPRRQEMEEHFKNVEALIGIIFYYCLLLTPMPHSGLTFENNG